MAGAEPKKKSYRYVDVLSGFVGLILAVLPTSGRLSSDQQTDITDRP